ncbi:MAG: C40 family peptidase [Planctomycetes bacterium]|nr:C40 family peptidase [Planctomycetota bacterium]
MIDAKQQTNIINKWIGTPYRYMGKQPGIGVDCIHLVREVLRETGKIFAIPNYPKSWEKLDPHFFQRELQLMEHLWSDVDENDLLFGDIALFKDQDGIIKHAAIVLDRSKLMHVQDDIIGTVRINRIQEVRKSIKRFIRII